MIVTNRKMPAMRFAWIVAALGLAVLSACASGANPLVRDCQYWHKIPGQYVYPPNVVAPVVAPGAGGTEEGAALINACVAREAQLDGTEPVISVWTAPGVSPQRGGTGGLDYYRQRALQRTIYPVAPVTVPPPVSYTPTPPPTAWSTTPQYTQRPACRPQQRGVTPAPLFC